MYLDNIEMKNRANMIVILWIQGVVLLTASLGLTLGAREITIGMSTQKIMLLLFGSGVLSLFVGAIVFLIEKKSLAAHKKRILQTRPLSLDDSFRALRAFGRQTPLYQDTMLQSRAFSISEAEKLKKPEVFGKRRPLRYVIEHWEGPALQVRVGSKLYHLEERSLLRVDDFEFDADLELIPMSDQDLSPWKRKQSQGIIHTLPLPESLS